MRGHVAIAVLAVALAVATTFAIWGAVGAPWQSEPPPTVAPTLSAPTPSFSTSDILALAADQVSRLKFPANAKYVRCTQASYVPGNGMWVVTCEYRVAKEDAQPVESHAYTLSDKTGKLQ